MLNIVYPLTDEQIELARHALGLRVGRLKSFRNRFVATPMHDDYANWMDMVGCGNAKYRDDPEYLGASRYFYLTRQGAEQALVKHESLCEEDFPQTTKEATV